MSLATYRCTLLAGVVILLGSTAVTAQHPHTDHQASPVACGMHAMESHDRATLLENTRRTNPALYDRLMSRSRDARLMNAGSGLEWTFLVRNRVTNILEEITATLVYDGIYSRVWVDNRDTGKPSLRPTSNTMRTLFKALDTNVVQTRNTPRNATQGILKNDIDVFGQIPQTYQVENKTDFLLLDIKDPDPLRENVLGYFSPNDQTETAESNKMNLLYIDSKEGFTNMQGLLGTIAHEFQHLIHYGRHSRGGDVVQRDVMINEGMSEVASIINGYFSRGNSGFLQNTNIDMLAWNYDNVLVEYEKAMTFVHYLSEHFGERLLYDIVGSPLTNMARIDDALRKYGMPEGFDYREILKGFAVANFVQKSSNPSFNYIYRLGTGYAKAHLSHTGPGFPTSGSASVNTFGTYYVQYLEPGPMQFRFGGSGDMRAMLIGMRNTDTTIVELQANTDYTLPIWAGGPYRRMAIAFVNTGGGLREVNWTAQPLTSAADLETGAMGRLAVQGAIDHGDGTMTLAYSLPVGGPVRLELYRITGELVATLIDGDVRAAGTNRESVELGPLANGTYVARLAQGSAATSGLIHVMR
jgi:hypothetical protein